jgi:hypothetical protein
MNLHQTSEIVVFMLAAAMVIVFIGISFVVLWRTRCSGCCATPSVPASAAATAASKLKKSVSWRPSPSSAYQLIPIDPNVSSEDEVDEDDEQVAARWFQQQDSGVGVGFQV